MMFYYTATIFCIFMILVQVKANENATTLGNLLETKDVSPTKAPRQMEYISLLSTLLQQTSMLSSVDGVMLAASTVLTTALTRARPLLVTGFMSYLIYASTALFAPGTAARMGILPARGARSAPGGIVAEAVMRSLTVSPVMSVITNVTVTVVTDAAARVRLLARNLNHQLRWIQGRVTTWSSALQSTCVERFLCRVGRFTQDAFPTVAAALRIIGNSSPNLDSFAVAMVRGTSSQNCSLVYPDCTL